MFNNFGYDLLNIIFFKYRKIINIIFRRLFYIGIYYSYNV